MTLGARIEEFDLEQRLWTVPSSRRAKSKGGGHVVPLTPRAVELVHELILRAAGSAWLFPSRRISSKRRFPHVGSDTLNRAIDDLAKEHGLKPFTVHDLRRTARTVLAREGVSPLVAELCMGHRIKGVAGVYDRHSYLQERREALGQLERFMEAKKIDGTCCRISKSMHPG